MDGWGSVVPSQDAVAVEDEVHAPDHTYRKSMWLQEMSDVKQTGGKGETENGE